MNKYKKHPHHNRFYVENKMNCLLNKIEKDIRFSKDLDDCLSTLNKLLDQPYFRIRIQKDIAEIYFYQGKTLESLNLLEELYKKDNNFEVLYLINKILFKIGDIDKIKKYVDNIEDSAQYNFLYGFINKHLGHYEEAIKNWNNLRFTVLEESAHFELGGLYHILKDNEKAKYHYKKILSTPYKDRVLVRLVEIALHEKNSDIDQLFKQCQNIGFYNKKDRDAYSRCLYYYKYKHGKLKKQDVDSYYSDQLYNYNVDMAIDHIYRHIFKDSERSYKILPNINLDQLCFDAKNHLDKLVRRDASDIYEVELDYDVGEMMGYKTNKVEVATIPYTNKILTLYPIANIDKVQKNIKKEERMIKC